MAHPQHLKRIILNLARTKDSPDGSEKHGYDLIAPLDDSGHLDAAAWHQSASACRVRRFWNGEPDETGRLVHRAGGSGGATWLFDYDPATSGDDEAGYKLAQHVFRPGEYVSVRDGEGDMHTFKVVSVTAA